GIPPSRVRTFVPHGILSRVAGRITALTGWSLDSWTHPMFSRWALCHLWGESWDVIHAWTGVAEEIYRDPSVHSSLRLVMRGSAHIRTQAEILAEEQKRVPVRIDQPSQWMIEREQREYKLADQIVVLSSFAYDGFRAQG